MVDKMKLQALEQLLKGFFSPVLAFSGGVDSRFLAHSMYRAGIRFSAVHITGEHVPNAESEKALTWLAERSIPYRTVKVSPLELPEVKENGKQRCYYCKRYLFSAILHSAGSTTVLDGTNFSDLGQYRPGLRALAELGVVSPLAEAEITKNDVRQLAQLTSMDEPDQPSTPCLLTRFAYGVKPDLSILASVERCEAQVRLFGLREIRLRILEDETQLLQIASGEFEIAERCHDAIRDVLRGEGFHSAQIRYSERISGFYDAP